MLSTTDYFVLEDLKGLFVSCYVRRGFNDNWNLDHEKKENPRTSLVYCTVHSNAQ